MGSVEPLKRLHSRWGERVRFVEVIVRQAHPGPGAPPYREQEEKLRHAEVYRRAHGLSWPVLVDDLEGAAHIVYGGLPDSSYILDAEGRVRFYGHWTHVPTLDRQIGRLLDEVGEGEGFDQDRRPHLLAPLAAGWPALQPGFPQSYRDFELALPVAGAGLRLGHALRRVLGPFALAPEPWAPIGRALAGAVGGACVGACVGLFRRGVS